MLPPLWVVKYIPLCRVTAPLTVSPFSPAGATPEFGASAVGARLTGPPMTRDEADNSAWRMTAAVQVLPRWRRSLLLKAAADVLARGRPHPVLLAGKPWASRLPNLLYDVDRRASASACWRAYIAGTPQAWWARGPLSTFLLSTRHAIWLATDAPLLAGRFGPHLGAYRAFMQSCTRSRLRGYVLCTPSWGLGFLCRARRRMCRVGLSDPPPSGKEGAGATCSVGNCMWGLVCRPR